MKRLIQAILLIWFLAVNIATLVPSYRMLFGPDDTMDLSLSPPPAPPQPPPPLGASGVFKPGLDATAQAQQVEAFKQQVNGYAEQIKGYTQEVTGYTQQMAGYKSYQEVAGKSGRRAVYELVVKGSLVTLLGSFATTLIAFVFANLGAGVVNNAMLMKNGREPNKLKLL